MTIRVTGAGIEVNEGLRAWAARRVALALGRFRGRVRRVTVRFSATPAASGAAARCQVAVVLGGVPLVVAERDGTCAHTALEDAAEAVGRGLSRRLEAARILNREL